MTDFRPKVTFFAKKTMNPFSGKWTVERTEPGPHLKLFGSRYDYMRNPRNGKTERMIIIESRDAVNIVALTPERELVMVRQYRFGIHDYTLELPGGLVETDEGAGEAARRELLEETGYAGDTWTYLGRIASNPVFMNSYIEHWMVEGAQLKSAQHLDDGEEVFVELVPLQKARRMLLDGSFIHPHAASGLLRFFVQLGLVK